MRALGAAWLRAASSGRFFSRWSWLLTLPFAVTILGGYDQARSGDERLIGFAIALAVHIALGIGGFVAAAGERRAASARSRIVIVIVTIVFIAIVRPLMLAGAADVLGVTPFAGPMSARIATNLVVVMAALSIIAMTTVTVRSHREVARRLRVVLRALEDARADDVADVADLSELVRRTTREVVMAALPPAAQVPADPERGALLLRAFAEEIVRPESHRLFDAVPPEPVSGSERGHVRDAGFPWRERRSSNRADLRVVLRALRAAPVWATAVGYALLWAPYLLARFPLLLCALAMGAAIVVGAAGNRVVERSARVVRRVRVGGLAGAYVVVGAGVGGAAGTLLAFVDGSSHAQAVLIGILVSAFTYPVLAVFAAIARAGFARLVAVEGELSAAADEASASAAAAHNRLVVARRRVAHLLHSDVQAECAAAARTLRRASVLADDDWALIIERIELAFDRSPQEYAPGGARDSIENVLEAWRFSMEIELRADDAAWARLDEDRARLELVVDVIAEGLTNVIRHGDELRARIALEAADAAPGVRVELQSTGSIAGEGDDDHAPVAARDGYGLAQLAARARRLSLSAESTTVVLRVDVA